MKKMFKYLLITILTIGFIGNVNALISKDEIDFDNQVASYNEVSDTFTINVSGNLTAGYYDVMISDDDLYDELMLAYNNFKDNPSEENKTLLSNILTTNFSNIGDSEWMDAPSTSYSKGSTYVRWLKVTNNETNTTTYSFGIHKEDGVNTSTGASTTNPDTGINALYLIPVMVVVGSVLVFKKRRYE